MKLDRLLAITMALLNQTRVSATELSQRFEVSLRTIYRDMEAINLAGIPIVSFAGSDGGYEIMSGYRIDKQLLSLEDFAAIVTALRGARSATDGSELDGLLERIGAMMPVQSGSVPDHHVDLDFQPSPNDKAKIGPLRQAIKDKRLIQMCYLDNKGNESDRTIEPMGLFLKAYTWYLYGYCRTRGAFRVFRLSRIIRMTELQETFERRNYSLQDVEREFMGRADFSKVRATLLFQPAARSRVLDEFGFQQAVNNPDGTLTLEAHYSSEEKAIQNILSYGPLVNVQEPATIRAELGRRIMEMAQLYRVKNE
ncbi:DeoR family transcriptional regulator [Paenibacillus sp. CCS19]|uniref:helix-turn-helix transcriptional regulator n=1 Tax=Paenibacillus sp. CCS19 TaxID=3158387 RepID=UPI00256DD8B7|nr:YafY family protein [Paenibacillus cellulosilyticus]GMK37213.1 DeoR family transcriptional regulator [Paenibacillus cellulosilyticus]